MSSGSPSITVITVVYNAERYIQRTIGSVARQSHSNLEHLIIDGGSTDGTLALLSQYPNIKVYSEPDRGIYDAMNKGLNKAGGEYVIFINAGDELAGENVLTEMLAECVDSDVYYGDTLIVNESRKVLGKRRHHPPKRLNWKSFRMGMLVSHQSILARRRLCTEYNLAYKISADIDWTINLMKSAKTSCYFDKPVSLFLAGGESTKRKRLGLIERWKISVSHYGIIATISAHVAIFVRAMYYFCTGAFRSVDQQKP